MAKIPKLTIGELSKDPEFGKLSLEAKRQVWIKIDPEFRKLSDEAQGIVLNKTFGLPTKETFGLTEQPPPPRAGRFEEFLEDVPEYAGGALGGLIGITGGFGVGGVPGAIGGAGLFGAGAKAAQQLIERGFGLEAPETAGEAAKELAIAGGRQAAFEAGGRLVVGIGGKILAPFRKSVTPESQIAEQTLTKFMPKAEGIISKRIGLRKPALLPAEATENKALDVLQNLAEGSLLGGGKLQAFKTKVRPQAINDMLDDFISQFGERADADMVSSLFEQSIKGQIDTSKLIATPMYNTVEQLVKPLTKQIPIKSQVPTALLDASGKPIMREVTEMVTIEPFSTSSLKSFVKPLVAKAKEIGSIEAKNAGDDLVMAINGLPNNVSYGAMKDLRSRLISRVDEFSIINKKAPAIGKAKKIIALVDNEIEKILKTQAPEAYKIWRTANAIVKERSKKLDNEFIRRLVKSGKFKPELIARNTFKTITTARVVKNAVDDATWTKFKSAYIQERLRTSITKGTVNVNGLSLFDTTLGRNGLGEKALRELFTPQEFNAFKDIVTTLRVLEERQGEGAGKVAISLMQPASLMAWVTGKGRTLATFILGGPAVIARLFTNPLVARYLKSVRKLPAKSPEAVALLSKISGLAYEIEQDMKRKGEIPWTQEELGRLPGVSAITGKRIPGRGLSLGTLNNLGNANIQRQEIQPTINPQRLRQQLRK